MFALNFFFFWDCFRQQSVISFTVTRC